MESALPQSPGPELEQALSLVGPWTAERAPEYMVSFGSGLSEIAERITPIAEWPYADFLGLRSTTALGHPGKVILGSWSGKTVLAFLGRLHFYEGHPWSRITFPVTLAHALGIKIVCFTNMSGGINSAFTRGALVVITDHLNLMGSNPLVGLASADPLAMFPDMQDAYSPRLNRRLKDAGTIEQIELHEGIYAAVSGPNYETPAEIRALRNLGADLVGMSTVGEVLLARRLGLELCAISCVANPAAGIDPAHLPIRHADVLAAAHSMQSRLGLILERFLRDL